MVYLVFLPEISFVMITFNVERICALVKLCILLSSISKLAYIVGKCLDALLGPPVAVVGCPCRYWEAKLSA